LKLNKFIALLVSAVVSYASAHAVTIPTVPIGNPGNPADTRYIDLWHPNGVGSVANSFRMGATEITNAQYRDFLNAVAMSDPYGLYDPSMGAFSWGGIFRNGSPGSYTYDVKTPALGGTYTYDNKPVVYVSSSDAMRLANWLHNGQPTGVENASATEVGAYTLNGAVTNIALAAITRNPGARWWLPNEDEWYKAAYHKNDGVTGNYWDYPTGANSVPDSNPPSSDTGNSANYYNNGYSTGDFEYSLTDAGAYVLSASAYGTFDQGGSVREPTETVFAGFFSSARGGSWFDDWYTLGAAYWEQSSPANFGRKDGFRLASIPEPASVIMCFTGVVTLALSQWQVMRRHEY
jgi:formylglycine-generating enzyme